MGHVVCCKSSEGSWLCFVFCAVGLWGGWPILQSYRVADGPVETCCPGLPELLLPLHIPPALIELRQFFDPDICWGRNFTSKCWKRAAWPRDLGTRTHYAVAGKLGIDGCRLPRIVSRN